LVRFWTGPTIEQTIKLKSHTSGFDLLRISLAFAIILWHTLLICYGSDGEVWFWTGPMRPAVYFLVPSFFALSGFLVAGSLERNDITTFIFYRAARIYPALAVEVTLSAIIFGVLFTTLPLSTYITNSETHRYLLNVTGIISYTLPGVFKTNPSEVVNIQLWTIPVELECYLLLVVMYISGALKQAQIIAAVLFGYEFIYVCENLLRHRYVPDTSRPSDYLTIMSFIYGLIFYMMRDKIRLNANIFLASLITMWLLLLYPSTTSLAIIPLTYVTVYLGMQNPRIPGLRKFGNYSYGIYLYGFSIQQAAYSTFAICRIPLINFIVSSFFAVIVAALSWHLVEVNVMRNRGRLYGILCSASHYWKRRLGKIAQGV
jgi:peptidoglycan/LPS O-acetylase OafA/YrhL